jgi:hypothetical protein
LQDSMQRTMHSCYISSTRNRVYLPTDVRCSLPQREHFWNEMIGETVFSADSSDACQPSEQAIAIVGGERQYLPTGSNVTTMIHTAMPY